MIAKGNLAEASRALAQSLAADPKFVLALYYRANIAASRGAFAEATQDLLKILSLDPTNMSAYLKMAQMALDRDQEPQAMAILGKAIAALPRQPRLRLALANYQISRRKFDDAFGTVNALLAIYPSHTEALALRAQIQIVRGQKREAVDTLRILVTAIPQSPSAQILLAKGLNSAGDVATAEIAAKRAVDLMPDSAEFRALLVDLQVAQNKPDAALATAQSYRSANPGAKADLLLANTLVRLKRSKDAIALLTTSVAKKPDAQLVQGLSQLWAQTGDTKRAMAGLASWLAKNPNDFETRRQYASLLLQTGERGKARTEFEALLKKRPEDSLVLNNLGWLLQDDDPKRALTLVSGAVKISPRNSDFMDTLGWLKFKQRDLDGALPLFRRAYELDADDGEIGYHLALALDETGNRAEAKSVLQDVVGKPKTFGDIDQARQLLARW
jgi:putative PEP-CTERM system TPR-repeat lipoprotein